MFLLSPLFILLPDCLSTRHYLATSSHSHPLRIPGAPQFLTVSWWEATWVPGLKLLLMGNWLKLRIPIFRGEKNMLENRWFSSSRRLSPTLTNKGLGMFWCPIAGTWHDMTWPYAVPWVNVATRPNYPAPNVHVRRIQAATWFVITIQWQILNKHNCKYMQISSLKVKYVLEK